MLFTYPEWNIRTVYLMLGFSCNFKCRHCLQTPTDTCSLVPTEDDIQRVISYINTLVLTRPPKQKKLKIIFFGGEPLLYWNIIETVVKSLGDKVLYSIITNGSLLDTNKIKVINTYNIAVSLSYDDKNTDKIRGIDITNTPGFVELFNSINNRGILATITAYNCDLRSTFRDIREVFGENINISIEPLRHTWGIPNDLVNFDLTLYQDSLHKMAESVVQDILTNTITPEVNMFLPSLCSYSGLFKDKSPLACGQIYNTLNIDLMGNIYSCHNAGHKVGTIDTPRYLLCNNQDNWVNSHKAPACMSCELEGFCKGGCPLETVTSAGNRKLCDITHIFWNEVKFIATKLLESFTPLDLQED